MRRASLQLQLSEDALVLAHARLAELETLARAELAAFGERAHATARVWRERWGKRGRGFGCGRERWGKRGRGFGCGRERAGANAGAGSGAAGSAGANAGAGSGAVGSDGAMEGTGENVDAVRVEHSLELRGWR